MGKLLCLLEHGKMGIGGWVERTREHNDITARLGGTWDDECPWLGRGVQLIEQGLHLLVTLDCLLGEMKRHVHDSIVAQGISMLLQARKYREESLRCMVDILLQTAKTNFGDYQ